MTSRNSDNASESVSESQTANETATISGLIPTEDGEMGRLIKDVLQLILPYTESNKSPPFSPAELAVISAVCWDPTDQFTILGGILKNFAYFGRLAIEQYVPTQRLPQDEDVPRPAEVVEGFDAAFNDYDLPFIDRNGKAAVLPYAPHYRDELEIEVLPRAARIFLRRWLEPKRKGVFPFFKLPAEIRNAIYEMLLVFPGEGIAVNYEGKLHAVRRREDAFEPGDFAIHGHFAGDGATIALDKRAQGLSLLRVNMQMYQEALPFFYGGNRFYCVSFAGTLDWLSHLSADRLKQLRDVRLDFTDFKYVYDGLSKFPKAMDKFADAAFQIRRLQLVCDDGDWIGMAKHIRLYLGRKLPIKAYEHIPGFGALAVVCSKAETLELLGKCKGIEEWVRGEMKLGKVWAAVQQAGGKKRKAPGAKGRTKQIGGAAQDGNKVDKRAKKTGTSSEVAEDEE